MKFDSQDFFGELLEQLLLSGLEFIVCGGVASILHGVERTTMDIDISVSLTPENVPHLVDTLGKLGMKPRAPVNPYLLGDKKTVKMMLEEKRAIVFTFYHPENLFLHLDVFLKPELQYEILKPFSEFVTFRDKQLQILSAEKLLDLKENIDPPRKKDEFDIYTLRKLTGRK